MSEAYIFDAVRTPRGKGRPDGALHEATPIHLSTTVLRALAGRNNLDTSLVDDVVLGCVSPVGEQGANIARISVINADYADSVAGFQLNRFCASGLEAVNVAAAQVMSGQSTFAIGGGVESMSRVPMFADGGAWSTDPAIAFKSYFSPQGIGADLIATKWGYSRTDVDAFAVASQQRAAEAWGRNRFARSVVPVRDAIGQVLLDHDEHMRPSTSMQSLAALSPSFIRAGEAGYDGVILQRYPEVETVQHVHHAGNSSGIVDGASAVLVGTKEAGARLGLRPRARIKGFASIGTEPSIMLTGPEKVTRKLLKRFGMTPGDIDLFEVNEAFASVVLLFMELLGVPHDKVNVNGGAIAMGHPLGATGSMLIATLLDELERRDLEVGLATLCVGAGMGTATIIERI